MDKSTKLNILIVLGILILLAVTISMSISKTNEIKKKQKERENFINGKKKGSGKILSVETFQDSQEKRFKIPKIIWSYWDVDPLPSFIKRCVQTWKIHNPEFTIRMLNTKNYKDYISNELDHTQFSPVTRFTDFLRFQLLAEHGGIWMDASIICTTSLQWVIDYQGYDFVGYYMPNFTNRIEYPIIENWFLAAPPQSKFIHDWNKEVQSIKTFARVEDYIESIKKQNANLQNIPYPEYLMCHAALTKVYKNMDNAPTHIKVMSGIAEKGPFYYLSFHKWDSKIGLGEICKDDQFKTPLIKIRGEERKIIENDPYIQEDIECLFSQ